MSGDSIKLLGTFIHEVRNAVIGSTSGEVEVVFSLGSNLEPRAANLRAAIKRLDAADMTVGKISSLYETDPVGNPDQPPFLNLALVGSTRLLPMELLHMVKAVEVAVGRKPTYRWGPRVVDIDILSYGTESVRLPQLQIPHPELAKRAFVLVPVCEILPDFRLVDGTSACKLAERLSTLQNVRKVGAIDTMS